MIKTADKILTTLENLLLFVAVCCLVAISLMVLLVIFERFNFGPGVPDDVVVLQQTMVVTVGCSLAYITRLNGHISIDLAYAFFGQRMQRIADFVALVVGLLASAPITYWAWKNFMKSVDTGAYYFGEINLPEWPAKLFFFIAFLTVSVRLALMLLQMLAGVRNDEDDLQPAERGLE
ncbi:hypothetical protein ATO6_19815 [Oceanicola sp. 22II-s10i]|uniref:TRAP transporter small permease n=1 Tax=Oceanicola sp. 22II-s10i TaxID=1317116 RepID=UPI000B524F00|nr:TRAP transporter small permease [Oceanicola sp. 22II-s10i]OWU83112.1 hypothetical protein ATO6_19815 [Oceanicola sp. 22II-s10i]